MADVAASIPVESRIVYIRSVAADELPEEARAQAPAEESFYAIHDEAGNRLAVVTDRAAAFSLARLNELTPVSAH